MPIYYTVGLGNPPPLQAGVLCDDAVRPSVHSRNVRFGSK